MTETITIRKPDDFHVHFREGFILGAVAPLTADHFGRAIAMPNTNDPIRTGEDALRYRDAIRKASRNTSFEPLMTVKITDATLPGTIVKAKECGVIAGKAYPVGVTTNAHEGVSDFKKLTPVFAVMEHIGMVLSLHGESPNPFASALKKEEKFLPILRWLVDTFPALKIVFEHVSTQEAVYEVSIMPDTVAATVTAHHLFLTIDDVIGGSISPHNFCKPIPKTVNDRKAIRDVVLQGSKKFFFGSDSAPHLKMRKECGNGSPGIFSAPVVLASLAKFFEDRQCMQRLEDFVSRFGAEFYGLPLSTETITLSKTDWVVPEGYDSIVPFMAQQKLPWKVVV